MPEKPDLFKEELESPWKVQLRLSAQVWDSNLSNRRKVTEKGQAVQELLNNASLRD